MASSTVSYAKKDKGGWLDYRCLTFPSNVSKEEKDDIAYEWNSGIIFTIIDLLRHICIQVRLGSSRKKLFLINIWLAVLSFKPEDVNQPKRLVQYYTAFVVAHLILNYVYIFYGPYKLEYIWLASPPLRIRL
jgi:hypothetical protein